MILPYGTDAQLTIGKEDKKIIINFDNTEHSFSIYNEKGGPRSTRWGDTNYAKGTEEETRGLRHITGIYGSNAAGEVMPTIY